jgi:hypothetical protein
MMWERNIWTGNDILRATSNGSIIRYGDVKQPYLYRAVYWGDYSLAFPVVGLLRPTLDAAKRDLATLEKESLVTRKEL